MPDTKPEKKEMGIGPRSRVVDKGEKGRGE